MTDKSFANGNGATVANNPVQPWRDMPGGNPNTTSWDQTIGRDPA